MDFDWKFFDLLHPSFTNSNVFVAESNIIQICDHELLSNTPINIWCKLMHLFQFIWAVNWFVMFFLSWTLAGPSVQWSLKVIHQTFRENLTQCVCEWRLRKWWKLWVLERNLTHSLWNKVREQFWNLPTVFLDAARLEVREQTEFD